jgi:hypothetical protein
VLRLVAEERRPETTLDPDAVDSLERDGLVVRTGGLVGLPEEPSGYAMCSETVKNQVSIAT